MHPHQSEIPLDRILIWNINSDVPKDTISYHMNLVIHIDDSKQVFNVVKNRWGALLKNVPLNSLYFFLRHPDIMSEKELNQRYWTENNKRME